MRRAFPRSLIFLVVAAVVGALQLIPILMGLLILLGAMLWSVLLINVGMLGTAWEAATGRVARAWLLLPIAFYGGYYAFAAVEHASLWRLRREYAEANARVRPPFDPRGHVLVAGSAGEHETGALLVGDFGLPIFYQREPDPAKGYRAIRMVDPATCEKIRASSSLRAGGTEIATVPDDETGRRSRGKRRFCIVGLPEQPRAPAFTVSRAIGSGAAGTMPLHPTATTIRAPDGRRFALRGGFAAPLAWFPLPALGCGLASRRTERDCGLIFLRRRFTPLLDTGSRFRSDDLALAAALGLRRVPPAERRGADPAPVLALAERTEAAALARDIAQLEAIVADPTVKIDPIPFQLLLTRPEMLARRADAAMAGLERAASAAELNRTHNNGNNLARLLATLEPDRLAPFAPRIVALYSQAAEDHWLWRAEELLARLGDLGPRVLPLLVAPAAHGRPARLRSIEAACRLGRAGRPLAPLLLAQWSGPSGLDERGQAFVAMRRIGIAVPPRPEAERINVRAIMSEWGYVGPHSPPRVCDLDAERRARDEERERAMRRANPL